MRLRIPVDQYDNALSYLHEHGYQVVHTKSKPNEEILIVAKRTNYVFNYYHWMFPESMEYLYLKDKFGRKAEHLKIDKPEAKE